MQAEVKTENGAAQERRPGRWFLLRWIGLALASLPLLLVTIWAIAALYLDFRVPWLRLPLAIAYAVLLWFGIRKCGRWWKSALVCVGAFLIVLGWWLCLQPSNARDWKPELVTLPYAEFNGEKVTVHNIRNCDYRTESDFTVQHYDRTYDLSQLRSVDLYLVHWGSPLIGHTMVSFGFDDGSYLCISIETRMQRGETYSAVRGFFRQFELAYVVADERDVVRLRTNYRQGEEVCLYRLKTPPERARGLLKSYLGHVNALHDHAEWYNALTHNCTTNIRIHAEAASGRRSVFDWRILLNGKLDELLAEHGAFAADLPVPELRAKCLINSRGKAADKDPDFSKRIRDGVPGVTL